MYRIRIAGAFLALVFSLSACASRPEAGFLMPTATVAPGATDHTILIVTTRARDARPNTLYDGERSSALDYATATISVPPIHAAGQIEWPKSPPGDPEREFVTRQAGYLNGVGGFDHDLKAELAKLPKGHRDIVLFVHGYNTLFAEGLYRFVQLTHDVRGKSVPVLFTWASRGALTQYLYDLNSATAARDALETTLRELAASGADHVHIIAHSMGNWVTVEALRQIRISGSTNVEDKLGLVALASPDIDVDVFKSEMRRYGKPKKPFIVLLSQDDHALEISTKIAGDKQRVGDYANATDLASLGVIVIDLTAIKGDDDSNHWKFAQADAFPPDVRALVEQSGISLPQANAAQRGNPVERFGSSLGEFVSSATNVVVALPSALVGR
jgi:esterase/lipase superfamily enzyme